MAYQPKQIGDMNEWDLLAVIARAFYNGTTGGSTPAGSATAANQATQITAEQAILSRLPAAYNSVVNLQTADGTIPVGALSWSITSKSGTVTVSGDALEVGDTVGGGGYNGATLATAITYTITTGSAMVVYDMAA